MKDGQWIAAIGHLHHAVKLKPADVKARELLRQASDRVIVPMVF
jgi:hypothetical protein